MTSPIHALKKAIPGTDTAMAIANFKSAVKSQYGLKAFNSDVGRRLFWFTLDGHEPCPTEGLSIKDQLAHMEQGTEIGKQLINVFSHKPTR